MLISRPPKVAFWLSCFAVLMMQLGPLISGAQGLWAQENAHTQPALHHHSEQAVHDAHAEHSMAQHAMMGHISNPALPQWVNNLKMCGYCDLLTFSPALVMQLVFTLPCSVDQPISIEWVTQEVHPPCLQVHAPPRAPPYFT